MAWTQADVDALKVAIASGQLSVKIDGQEIVYRSITDLQKALAMVQADVNQQNSVKELRQTVLYQ